MPATVTSTINSTVHTITLEASGNIGQFASLYQLYIAANTARSGTMSYDSETNTYTLHRLTATYTYLIIGSNCQLQLAQDETLIIETNFTSGATTSAVFRISPDGKLTCKAGSHFVLSSSGGGYLYIYGYVQCLGTPQKPVIWQSYYRNNYYGYNSNKQDSIFQYTIFKNVTSASGYFFAFNIASMQRQNKFIFRNVTFTNDNPDNKYGYGFYFNPGGMFSNITMQNITAQFISSFASVNGTAVKLCNAYISDCGSNAIVMNNAGGVISPAYQTSKDDTQYQTGKFQPFTIVQNIIIDNAPSTSAYGIQATINSLVYIKNVTLLASNGIIYRSMYPNYASTIIYDNLDDSALSSNISRRIYNGPILVGHQLDITVLDQSGQPLSGAIISVKQADGKQMWSGYTNQLGKLVNIYGDNPVYIEKQQTYYDTYEDWSTHYIMITAYGYRTYTEDIIINEPITKSIKLIKLPEPIHQGNNMEYEIVQEFLTSLQEIEQLGYIGQYPYDYQYIQSGLPALLIKYGDTIVDGTQATPMYNVQSQTQFLIYTTDSILKTLQIEQKIIKTIIDALHRMNECIIDIGQTTIQTGDISDYITPSDPGYNANIKVRKITQNYTFRKIIQ